VARPRRRTAPRRRLGTRILIVCEGARDEYDYLRGARASLRLSQANVAIRFCGGGSPQAVVASALRWRDRYAGNGEERFDEIWVVLDVENPKTSGIEQALETARREGLRIALSNPCFEIWLLLHAGEQDAPLNAREAKRRLRRVLRAGRGWRPGFDDPRLGADWRRAARRALRGREAGRLERGTPSESWELVLMRNPSSNLDELLHVMQRARPGSDR
jgi:hypothetical protein